ncbi:MAG: hypothetical protein JNL82_05985 [Myxococcales bacterium]|nr:hypothetical protein [Myxococcales bacterium]
MHRALALALALAACGDDGSSDQSTTGTSVTTVTATAPTAVTDSSASATDSASAPTSSATDGQSATGDVTSDGPTAPTSSASSTSEVSATGDDTSTIKLDMPIPDFGGDTDGATGCFAVDLLFVIDNSPSMGPYQEALGAAFPQFADLMFSELPPGTDLHVGIVTTSFFDGSCSESTNNCKSQASDAEILAHYDPPTDGNNGENGGQGRLYSWQGMSYFAANTDDDPAALKAWFTGAAISAGETGCSFEMPAAAAGWAADPANAATNAGFIRDESAVLLVFVLSDEPDKSPEPVGQFVDKLVAAKSACGGLDCILAAGLVDTDFCYDHPADTTLKTFLESFSAPPIVGSIGSVFPNDPPPDYTGVVGQALAQVIGQKCEELPPPG